MSANATIHLSQAPSYLDRATALDRIDPYWHGWFTGAAGHPIVWDSAEVRGLRRADERPMTTRHPVDPKQAAIARESVLRGRTALASQQVLAIIGQHRSVTSEQLQTLTGLLPEAVERITRRLHRAGLIERGTAMLVDRVSARKVDGVPVIFRLAQGTELEHLLAELPHDRWLAITGGRRMASEQRQERHNILATEITCRLLEHCPPDLFGAIYGEQMLGVEHLHPLFRERFAGNPSVLLAAPDSMFVRSDGLRIAFEVTRSLGRNAQSKIDRWCQLLAAGRPEQIGTHVVFVFAGHPKSPHLVKLAKMIRSAVNQHSISARWLPDVIHLVAWRDWFPEAYTATPAWFDLEVRCPTAAGEWSTRSLLDVIDTPAPAGDRWLEPLRHAPSLAGAICRRL